MSNYVEKIGLIRFKYLHGIITLEEAKSEVQPILDEMNEKGKKVAKKYKKNFHPITFSSVFR